MHVPRERLHPEFCRAIRECGVTQLALAPVCGYKNTHISKFLRSRRINSTPLHLQRLGRLAAAISYAGPIFVERRPA